MVVNSFVKTLICLPCQVAQTQDQLASHIQSAHQEAHIQLDHTKLAEACSNFDILPELPNIGLGPIEEVQGLKVLNGFVCNICGALSMVEDQMSRHHSKHHSSIPKPAKWQDVKMQRLNHGTSRCYFQIYPQKTFPLAKTDEDIIMHYRQLVQESWDINDDQVEARLVNAWLRTTKWHKFVGPYETAELQQLIAPLAKDEYQGLRPAIIELLTTAMDVIKKLPELVLERLNTPDPAKT